MIANITWGADFRGIVRYLTENRDHQILDLTHITSIDYAADEMAAVAGLNTRATNKLLHVSLSAAQSDGRLDDATWMHSADLVTRVMGLEGHMRVVVRHRDKKHDHVHIFFCLISSETGLTPPKRWFVKKGSGANSIGPHALSDAQVEAIAPTHRARRTYDFRALARCQDACRQLERGLGLRRLKTPLEAAQARVVGAHKSVAKKPQRRTERTGSTPLFERAVEIRQALAACDWPSKQCDLAAIGLEIEPVYRNTKNGQELRGVMLVDAHDPGNRLRASDLDLPELKYGVRRLEERHDLGAERLEQWWPKRRPITVKKAINAVPDQQHLKEVFQRLKVAHIAAEREKADKRKLIKKRYAQSRAVQSRASMQARRHAALKLPPSERRAFYSKFAMEVARPAIAALNAAQAEEISALSRTRQFTWKEYLAAAAPHPNVRPTVVEKRREPIAVERSDEHEKASEKQRTQYRQMQSEAVKAPTTQRHSYTIADRNRTSAPEQEPSISVDVQLEFLRRQQQLRNGR